MVLWRFNGYGYFYGLLSGILSAMIALSASQAILGHPVSNALYLIPAILVLSAIGCLAGTLLTEPEDVTVLKHFYKQVRPWGFWGPIRDEVLREDPTFRPNGDLARDLLNVLVGIVWQTTMVLLPIYLVLRQWTWVAVIAGLLVITSGFLKFNWYDKLEKA